MANSNVTTESGGRQNMFPTETRPYMMSLFLTTATHKMPKKLTVVGQ